MFSLGTLPETRQAQIVIAIALGGEVKSGYEVGMSPEDFSFSSPEGSGKKPLDIACYRWPASGKAVGVLQISHGMGEHSLRYEDVAHFLSRAGFHVYADDHRGH